MEVPYSTIRSIYQSTNASSTGGLRRDDNMDAPFFNTVENKDNKFVVFQYWYDDVISLKHKYAWAREQNLRGVGPYTFSDVDSSGIDADIWSAFDVFFQDNKDDDLERTVPIQ
jgi:spore germination protein YaaH